VHNLVGVDRLLKRLEFLFELPGRLKKSIDLGAIAQVCVCVCALRVLTTLLKGCPLLQASFEYSGAVQPHPGSSRWLLASHLARCQSFEKIRVEADTIASELKTKIREVV
jgi:hypothetical protein